MPPLVKSVAIQAVFQMTRCRSRGSLPSRTLVVQSGREISVKVGRIQVVDDLSHGAEDWTSLIV